MPNYEGKGSHRNEWMLPRSTPLSVHWRPPETRRAPPGREAARAVREEFSRLLIWAAKLASMACPQRPAQLGGTPRILFDRGGGVSCCQASGDK